MTNKLKALTLLRALERAFKAWPFNVRAASVTLATTRHTTNLLLADPELAQRDPMLRCLRIKTLSNDIKRLYYMDLLKRRRKLRKAWSRKRGWVNRGFEYEYSISAQGFKYLVWKSGGMLRKGMDTLAQGDEVFQALQVCLNAKGDTKDVTALLELYKTFYKGKNKTVHKRFPSDTSLRLFEQFVEHKKRTDLWTNQMMTLAEWKEKEEAYRAIITNLTAKIKMLEDERQRNDNDIVNASLRIDAELARHVRQASLRKTEFRYKKKNYFTSNKISTGDFKERISGHDAAPGR